MTITVGEKFFFERITSVCDIVFDVGTRDDTYYPETFSGAEYWLFEPNREFYDTLVSKIKDIPAHVHVYNHGLSNKNGMFIYYPDSQSFIKRTVDFHSADSNITFLLEEFGTFVHENKIDHIDFLKMDIEGCEPDILMFYDDYIRDNVSFVQFEYASTWLDRNVITDISDVFDVYGDLYDFGILKNDEHPISVPEKSYITLFSTQSDFTVINSYMKAGYGFEIVMMKRGKYEHLF